MTTKNEAIQNFNNLPLSSSPLSKEEVLRLEANLMPLLRYLGAPGDWGYETKLGRLTQVLHGLRSDIRKASLQAVDN